MIASTGELHTASGGWLSNVLALAKFAVRRPKTRWVHVMSMKPKNLWKFLQSKWQYSSSRILVLSIEFHIYTAYCILYQEQELESKT